MEPLSVPSNKTKLSRKEADQRHLHSSWVYREEAIIIEQGRRFEKVNPFTALTFTSFPLENKHFDLGYL